LSGSFTQSHSHTATGSGTVTLLEAYGARLAAYPGYFYPGQVYPGQPFDGYQSASFADSRSGTLTLSGSASEAFTSGGTIYNDAMSGSITLSGTADEAALGPPLSGEGTITLSGDGVESRGRFLHIDVHGTGTLVPVAPGALAIAAHATGTATLAPHTRGTLTLVPDPPETLPLTPRS
jgi:hypothetical protein